jgi:hypothetical protein
MTWFNRILIIIAAALILFAIGRFVLKSWIFAVAAAAVVAVVLGVYFARGSRGGSAK